MVANTVAERLADMYEDNSAEDGSIPAKTMQDMADLFEAVKVEHREQVFGEFLDELDFRGVQYNVKEFRGEVQ